MNSNTLTVMLIDDHPHRAAMVEEALARAGCEVSSVLPSASGLLFQIEKQRPDVVLIDLESPDRDVLESLSIISHHNPTPIVMFSEQDDPSFIADAVQAGVTAYQVDGINPEKVKPIIDVAIAQFKSFHSLKQALLETQIELDDRKMVERAKVLLMKQHKITEPQAFKAIRDLSMNTNQPLGKTAGNIVAMLEPQAGGKRT